MQAISAISRSTAVRLSPARPEPPAESAPPRALVPVLPIVPSEFTRVAHRYPAATFLAHLIAVRQRSPQTRRRARAAPSEAAAAYAAARATPVSLGQAFKRSA